MIEKIKNIINLSLEYYQKIEKITIILKSNKTQLNITEKDVDGLESSTTLPGTWKIKFNKSKSIPNSIKDLIKTIPDDR